MNEKLFYFFNNLVNKSEFFDQIVIFFADYFIFIVFLSIIFYFFFKNGRNFKDTIFVIFTGFSAWALSHFLKDFLRTERPFIKLSDVHTLVEGTGYAFPSGHTISLAAMSFFVLSFNRKLGYIFLICTLLVGISRIIAGVHFPIDIIGGFVLGASVSFVMNLFYRRKS